MMSFLKDRKLIRRVLKECPLPHAGWHFRLEFTGNYSTGGHPLVNASVWKGDYSTERMDIKQFVLQNAYSTLSPLNYLV